MTCSRPHCWEVQQKWKVLVEEAIVRRVSIVLAAVVYSVRTETRLDIEVDVVPVIVVAAAAAAVNAIVHIEGETAALAVGQVAGIVVIEVYKLEESMWWLVDSEIHSCPVLSAGVED